MNQQDNTVSKALANRLNVLAEEVRPRLDALHVALTGVLQVAGDDYPNRLRVALVELLSVSLEAATEEEKTVFVSAIVERAFGDKPPSIGVAELPVPEGLSGTEILRVFKRGSDGNIVAACRPMAEEPDAWGLVLHDVAQHLARAAVEVGAIEAKDRKRVVDAVARAFAAEHRRPTDTARAYKPKLDS